MKSAGLKAETEGLIIAAQEQSLLTRTVAVLFKLEGIRTSISFPRVLFKK